MSEIQNQVGGDHYRKMSIAEVTGRTLADGPVDRRVVRQKDSEWGRE